MASCLPEINYPFQVLHISLMFMVHSFLHKHLCLGYSLGVVAASSWREKEVAVVPSDDMADEWDLKRYSTRQNLPNRGGLIIHLEGDSHMTSANFLHLHAVCFIR